MVDTSDKEYKFIEQSTCNMCGVSTVKNKCIGQRLNKSIGIAPWKKQGISVSVIKCIHCGLIYSNPLPVPLNIQDHYGMQPEEYWEIDKTEQPETYFSTQISRAKDLINKNESKLKALDIGTGQGQSFVALNQAGFDTYGIEASETFRNYSIEKLGIDPDRLKLGMVEDADYPNDYFDFITFGAVLEHLYNPYLCIKNTLDWLKPGGVIQIEVPSSRHLISKIINFYYKITGTNYVTNLSPMHPPYHLYEFDLKSFEINTKKLSFEIAEYHYYVCKIYHLPSFLHPLLRTIMKKNNSGMQLEVWLKKIL